MQVRRTLIITKMPSTRMASKDLFFESGDVSWFNGVKKIYYGDKLVYELVYHGGITIINTEGAYTHEDRSLLMMVVSSYEVYIALETLHSVDSHAFTNVLQNAQIQGNFGCKIVDKAS